MKCVRIRVKKSVVFIPQFSTGLGAGEVLTVVESLAKALFIQFPDVFEEVAVIMKDKLRFGMYQFDKESEQSASAVKDAAQALSPAMPEPVEVEKKISDKSMAAKSKTKRK